MTPVAADGSPWSGTASAGLQVAVVADFAEERWYSMDLAANVLLTRLGTVPFTDVVANRLRPTFTRRLTRIPGVRRIRRAEVADRVINRFWDYPRWLSGHPGQFDVFHIVDHSYAHLALGLPARRTIVSVHDVDAFLTLVDPSKATSAMPKTFARRILRGLQRAARVHCISEATRHELTQYGLVSADRAFVAHMGVDAVFSPEPDHRADIEVAEMLGPREATVDILHCGSTIGRKRIDILLSTLAALHSRDQRVRLIKVGGALTEAQAVLARRLGVAECMTTVPFVDTRQLAALYRRARVMVVPSDREGFCLPLAEALACGTAVVASDIPVLREVGEDCCSYAPVGDVGRWTQAVWAAVQQSQADEEPRRKRVRRAAVFSWDRYTKRIADVYRQLAREGRRQTEQAGAVE